MSRTLCILASFALAAAGCAERRYPWPDFDVAADAWVPLPTPPRAPPPAVAPVLAPGVQPPSLGVAPAVEIRS